MACAPVVTIDGPSGSGKGTLSQTLTRRLGWHFLDSGALYRIAALAADRRGLDPTHAAATRDIAMLAAGLQADFRAEADGSEVIFFEGRDVTQEIRSEWCGDYASRVAVLAPVREALLAVQRDFRQPPGLIADGRDMGTVVFPAAELKIFLVASAEERALRRFKQLKALGISANLNGIVGEIVGRDTRDRERTHAPLVAAPDAVVMDTTGQGAHEVVMMALSLIAQRGLGSC